MAFDFKNWVSQLSVVLSECNVRHTSEVVVHFLNPEGPLPLIHLTEGALH